LHEYYDIAQTLDELHEAVSIVDEEELRGQALHQSCRALRLLYLEDEETMAPEVIDAITGTLNNSDAAPEASANYLQFDDAFQSFLNWEDTLFEDAGLMSSHDAICEAGLSKCVGIP
jgi:hypothetical protein